MGGGILHLIDFGLSNSYLERDDTNPLKNSQESFKQPAHIKLEKLNKFTGNFIFASQSSCLGYTKSRRDDIESAFYMVTYLLNGNSLPWLHLCNHKLHIAMRTKERLKPEMQAKLIRMLSFDGMIPKLLILYRAA